MNRRTLGIVFMALMVLGIAIPFTAINNVAYATITGRPIIKYNGSTAVQLQIPAGSEITLNLTGMTITGAQIWLWFSTDGSAVITPTDVWYIGPINVYQIFQNSTSASTIPVSATFGGGYLVVHLGNGVVNFTLPKIFEAGVTYWIKVTDVNPYLRPNIASSEVAVSVNNFTVIPVFEMKPSNYTKIVPNQPITITGYSTSVNGVYNVTTNVTTSILYTIKSEVKTIPAQDYNPAWNYTVVNFTFPAYDLKLVPGDNAEGIQFSLVDNSTRKTVIYGNYTELNRTVVLSTELGAQTPANNAVIGSYTDPAYYIGRLYSVDVSYFPYLGTINITLSNSTLGYNFLLAKNVALNETGNATVTICIPDSINASSYFWLNITDNNGVTVSFKVYVKVAPIIKIIPNTGYVGDKVIVSVSHAYDYINGTLTLLYNVTSTMNVTLATLNITTSAFNFTVTIPQSVWGLHMFYGNFTNDGKTYWAYANFTVMAKVVVIPPCIEAGKASFITINATGLNATGSYIIFVDTIPIGELYGISANDNGTLAIKIPATNLAPGEHIVALYDYYSFGSSLTGQTMPIVYTVFCVNGTSLSDIASKLNEIQGNIANITQKIDALKDLINQVGGNITLKLEDINGSLATLIIEKNNEVLTSINMSTSDLKTLIKELVTGAEDNITIQLQGIKLSISDLKALVSELGENLTIVLGAIENTNSTLLNAITSTNSTLYTIITGMGGKVMVELQDIKTGISDIKALITSLGDDISLKLQSINNSLATLIIEKNNEVLAKICAKLNELNATIVSIKGDTVYIKTAIGDIQTTLQDLKNSNAELKDLIITKSGEIEGVIQTAAGNITTKLDSLEQLIKSGLKVDTQTLLSKIDEIKSQLGSISGSVSDVSSKLDQLASTLDDLKSMLSNVQSTVSNVQSTVTDIKSSLQDIKNTASGLASKIESTANDIKSYISSQNSDLKKAVEGISGTVSTYGIISIILIIIAIAVSGYGIYKKKE